MPDLAGKFADGVCRGAENSIFLSFPARARD
jgi:hypothetical protein